MRRLPPRAVLILLAPLTIASPLRAVPHPVASHFESAHVHPAEISPDGTRLFVVDTADHKLSIFDLTAPAPRRIGQVAVGLEPVSVRARTKDEVWVVNHVSDDVSIVKISEQNVVRTLLVGDEPTDVVFVPGQHAAFVCVSQEDLIRVYDTNDLNALPTPIPLEMSDPRSLALSPDRATLYVCALDSQNKTTAVPFSVVQSNGGPPPPNPPKTVAEPAPDVALIVKHDGTAWRDEAGTSWSPFVPYTLLDKDVIRISTASRSVVGSWSGVGATLFNVAVNPATGRLYVTNQEATNHIRFEPNLKGQFVQNRVTTIDPGSSVVTPVHLNTHIDYANPAGSSSERAQSLAMPLEAAVSTNGTRVYVAAFGSRKVGVLDASGNVLRRIVVGEGPSGVALDEARSRLYVVNRFASTLSVVDLATDSSVQIAIGFDPSAPEVVAGRRFLYDGELSSAHGDLACASCHVFGAMDNLSWDLGDPQGTFVPPAFPFGFSGFHPMKGPMTTQSLRGLTSTEPFHWRGDRTDFIAFNPAFVSLMGRQSPLAAGDMQAFEDFVLTMKYPPSPNRQLDGSHLPSLAGGDPAHGEDLFLNGNLVGGADCVSCHTLPSGENGAIIPFSVLAEDQDMKVPQLRNLYEKTRFDNTAATNVRGFGYVHDGAVDDLFSFLDFPAFDLDGGQDQVDVASFLLAFDTGTHAAVGAQWTMDGTNEAQGIARVNTLVTLANANVVGLVAKGRDGAGEGRGWVYEDGLGWRPDRQLEPHAPLAALLADAGPGTEVTFTAVLEGNELRLGVDQDGDGYFDQDEDDVGADPADPGSTPADFVGVEIAGVGAVRPELRLAGANPTDTESRLAFHIPIARGARLDVFDLSGRRVRTLAQSPAVRAGRSEAVWDLRDASGRPVSNGVYFVKLETLTGSAGQRVVVLR